MEGHPSTPILGQFVPSPSGEGGGAFYPTDSTQLSKMSTDGNLENVRGTVVNNIPGSLPIPITLSDAPGPGLPIGLKPVNVETPGVVFTPLSNPNIAICGTYSPTPGSAQDVFTPKDSKNKLPPGPTPGYVLMPSGQMKKGTLNPSGVGGTPTFVSDSYSVQRGRSINF